MRLFVAAVVAGLVLGVWAIRASDVAAQTPPSTPMTIEATPDIAEFDSDGDGWMTPEEFAAALAASVAVHTWPDAYPVNAKTILDTLPQAVDRRDGSGAGYVVGVEHILVGLYNTCAWYIDWLDALAEGDDEREAVALDAILTILPANPDKEYREIGPDLRDQFVREARQGDPTGLQQFVDDNCQHAPFATPAARG